MLAIVQARCSSSRLPGKVLLSVNGQPMLDYLLQRLARCRGLGTIVLATSLEPSDDALESFAAQRRIACVRGPLDDVAARFRLVLQATRAPAFVRVNGDSPLLDPVLVDRVVALFREGGVDLATNVHVRSFPKGQSVEVLDTATFVATSQAYVSVSDREHVTPFYYANAQRFRIRNLDSGRALGEMRMVIDTQEDLERFRAVLARMDRPHWKYGLDELISLYQASGG
jgi:spore coat polysaccharide biosynthesis protein SpsF